MSEPDAPPSASKERHSLTLDQRRALRRWANSQTTRPSHKACIAWFEQQYHQTISQSTVSHSLSPKYARLDGDPQLSGSRLRFGNWPDVEKLVLLWHKQMISSGRQPTNDELAEKAKSIFTQLPRYKDETPPEFSPGWIHRFKKRYGLLMRRQRRHSSVPDPANDIPYLIDAVPRFMSVGIDTSPAAIRDAVQRVVGVEASLATCARVRDDIVRQLENPPVAPLPPPTASSSAPGSASGPLPPLLHHPHHPSHHHQDSNGGGGGGGGDVAYHDDDPEMVLQNALRALQQEEADAEAEAAALREDRERLDRGLPPLHSTGPGGGGSAASNGQAYAQHAAAGALATPVSGGGRMSAGGPPTGSGVGHHHPPQQPSSSQAHPGTTNTTTQAHTPPLHTPQGIGSRFASAPHHHHQRGGGGGGGGGGDGSSPGGGGGGGGHGSGRAGAGEDLTLTPIQAAGPVSAMDRPVRCPFCVNHRVLRTIKEAVEHMSTHVVV